jgi:DNA-binding transcriptional MerR regulator
VTEPLLTISAFARAVDLAPGTLRYYDEAGLLPPAEVDPRTGYRYYTPALQRRAHMIRRMREVGVPVDTMRLVLDSPPDRAAEVLRAFAARSAEEARRTADAVADVISSLRQEEVAQGPVTVPLHGPELAAALDHVSVAASADPDSPLGVVLLDVGPDQLTVVATDRYWLTLWTMPLPGARVGERRAVVPLSEVGKLAGWLARQEQVVLTAGEDTLSLTGEEGDLVVPLGVDRFPAYRLILDDQPPARGRTTLERSAVLRAIVGETGTMRLAVGADRVTLSPLDGPEGVRVAAVTTGETVTIGFSVELLRAALSAVVGSQVTLHFSSAERAVRVSSPEQRGFTALVMPVRLG